MAKVNSEYDAIIIGAGPAGSTAATVLARHGRSVAILERNHFPRYHVGESLMPYCYFTLNRLGVIDQLRCKGYPEKYSVQFVGTDGTVSSPFYFFEHMDHPCTTTWQVWRSEFDQMLLEAAVEAGARVYHGTSAKTLIASNGGVVGVRVTDDQGATGEFRGAVTIDASGRDMFTGTRMNWRQRDPKLSKVSIWTYYRNALRDPGLDAGATTVAYLPEKGWFWYIPMRDNRVSVGVVAEKDYLYRNGARDPGEILQSQVANNPWIERHLAPAEQVGEYWVTGDYSYRSRYCGTNGLLLVGDAYAFLDPVFSSGVFLALKSGELGADAVHAALENGDVTATAFEGYAETMCGGIEAMRKLVYAFYDRGFSFGKVIREYPDRRGDLTDCLIGDLFRDFTGLFEAVGCFAELPEPLPYGRPTARMVHD